jgi:hypothetical protein
MSGDIFISVQGDGIYETMSMPVIPRKGDILWLNSLTRGGSPEVEVMVSKVEWAREQQSGAIHVWLTVRRMPRRDKALGR